VHAVVHENRLPGDEPGYVQAVEYKYRLPGDEPGYVHAVVHDGGVSDQVPSPIQAEKDDPSMIWPILQTNLAISPTLKY